MQALCLCHMQLQQSAVRQDPSSCRWTERIPYIAKGSKLQSLKHSVAWYQVGTSWQYFVICKKTNRGRTKGCLQGWRLSLFEAMKKKRAITSFYNYFKCKKFEINISRAAWGFFFSMVTLIHFVVLGSSREGTEKVLDMHSCSFSATDLSHDLEQIILNLPFSVLKGVGCQSTFTDDN